MIKEHVAKLFDEQYIEKSVIQEFPYLGYIGGTPCFVRWSNNIIVITPFYPVVYNTVASIIIERKKELSEDMTQENNGERIILYG